MSAAPVPTTTPPEFVRHTGRPLSAHRLAAEAMAVGEWIPTAYRSVNSAGACSARWNGKFTCRTATDGTVWVGKIGEAAS